MALAWRLVLLLSLAGCAGLPPPAPAAASPCDAQGEASWACQVERYDRVSA